MNQNRIRFVVIWITVFQFLVTVASEGQDATPKISDGDILFVRDILPLFKAKCLACHGEDRAKIKGKLDMTSRALLIKGGASGEPGVDLAEPMISPLLEAISRTSEFWAPMPPKENDKLTPDQIKLVERWVLVKAPWPKPSIQKEILRRLRSESDNGDRIEVATSGGLSDEWTNRKYLPDDLWAYQPIREWDDDELSRMRDNPIDFLIDKKLKERGIQPAPPADRVTLIRRATFDLIGLPPTPKEVEDFVRDSASDRIAFRQVIDRLLDSPHYGEQWARHWLDVVRYADSSGYANDYERGNAWRYRDYVVRSFNDDKPYDQFVTEQIAGDELNPDDPELLIAVGFLRMGPWELTGMEVARIARQRFLDDVTDSVGQTFLAHMLQCARCHDHKFDPIPTRDYYSFQAIFATTQLTERKAAFLDVENRSGFEEKRFLDRRKAFYEKTVREVGSKTTIAAARQWYRDNSLSQDDFDKVLVELKKRQPSKKVTVKDVRQRLAEKKVSPDLIPPRHVGFEPVDFGLERIARKGLERLKWRMERYQPIALSVYNGRTPQRSAVKTPQRVPTNPHKRGRIETTSILVGGDPFSGSEPVSPNSLSVINRSLARMPRFENDLGQSSREPRRTRLAQWITHEDNPLTSRVMANRLWQWHFGKALAANPNNFGATGQKPTHPEVLDWLAFSLKQGWSLKSIHRQVLMSRAWQRSTRHPDPESIKRLDPTRQSYAVFTPRRLDAEELRDSMLMISGELNLQLGGIPSRPEMNLEAALQPRMVMGSFAEAWQPAALPSERHRRSLYALKIRGQRDPFFEVFNAPASDLSCEARESSTITPQVFAMFNSAITFDRALTMAARVDRETGSVLHALKRVFRLAYSRDATPKEIELCTKHWTIMLAKHKRLTFQPPSYPLEVVRDAVEENTGERFSFTEPLEVYTEFEPDLKACDVTPEIRALAEVCLVLMNSNEFAYVH